MREDLYERYGPWALVAGASEGIGEQFARRLAAAGLSLVVVARREDKLRALAGEVRAEHGVEVRAVATDLGQPDVIEALRPATDDVEVGLVVYNACKSVIGTFLELSLADRLATLDVNCRGPVLLASAYAPAMVERRRGGLILMSSMSGFQGSAMVGVYAATKAFDTVLGEALWEELGHHGIDVLVCAAGATSTPGFERNTPEAKQSMAYPMDAEQVVTEALQQLGAGRPTWIPGRLNRTVQNVLNRLLPRGAAVRFISRTTRAMYEDG